MDLTRKFRRTRFPPEVLTKASDSLFSEYDEECLPRGLGVDVEEGLWKHDTEEEFFADYRRSSGLALFQKESRDGSHTLQVGVDSDGNTEVTVGAPERSLVLEVVEVFERAREQSRLPEPPAKVEPPPTVFIGHGGSSIWRDLKDHLHEKHCVEVEAYEIGARAGHVIRDILESMLARSSFALLVMTGEDETADGGMRARQNVVHEAGLFQGRLGFNRAIVLLEEGTEAFSNIQGIQRIDFSRGNIRETFGEVLATIRREFPQSWNNAPNAQVESE